MSIDITNDELFKSQRDFDLVEEISVIDDDCSSNSSNASKSHKMAKPMQNPKSVENSEDQVLSSNKELGVKPVNSSSKFSKSSH